LGKILLVELTANDLQQFYAQMKKSGRLNRTGTYGEGLSDRMVRACHTRCLTALDRAVLDGLIRLNPAADCKLSPQNTKEMQLLSREEMQRFLIQAKEETSLDKGIQGKEAKKCYQPYTKHRLTGQ